MRKPPAWFGWFMLTFVGFLVYTILLMWMGSGR